MRSWTLDDILSDLQNPNVASNFTDSGPQVPDVSAQPPIPPPRPQSPQAQSISTMPREPQSQPAPTQMDPVVKEYLLKKFDLGEHSDENRQKLVEQNTGVDLGDKISGALSAIGAGFQGRDAGAAMQSRLSQIQGQKKGIIDQFDKARDQKIQSNKMSMDEDLRARESDPASQESVLAQSLAKKMLPNFDFASMSAEQINKQLPSLQKLYGDELRRMEMQNDQAYRRAVLDKDAAREMEKRNYVPTLEERISGLPASEKGRFDSAKMGRKAVGDMMSALKGGDNTFTLWGDNNYTQARTRFEEALGRMQSGGAINEDEEARFKKMAPTVMDSPEMQAKKLADLQAEMDSRLGTLGFKPDELGFKQDQMYSGDDQEKAKARQARIAELRAKAMGSGVK